ncbi:DUF2911 domain-containing protein [Pedobacter nototheniae]|uniref:DUF2911 domain-containing protein n=1 Tax=Pedobacter nototheniae TaxID=2488994 RepID=UPI0029316AD3|nr:DUF2911 domain-containing protein [Pedobacter nototheniae]
MKKASVLIILIVAVISVTCFAQNKKPRLSLPDTVTAKLANTNITITYSRPAVNGRKIWGGLVPYDSVWRAGANEATTFHADKDITVQGKLLPAGTYAFFLIPRENAAWIAIFNKVDKQWGAFKYDEKQDQLRVEVQPVVIKDNQELLRFLITPKGILLEWENISLPIYLE